MKEIKLTEEEVKKFYYQKNSEEICSSMINSKTLTEIIKKDEDSVKKYVDEVIKKHAEVYTESNLFINHLKKKYEVNDFIVNGDTLIER